MTTTPNQTTEKDVAGLRDHASRVFKRMMQTPCGPKRKRLADQHVELTNEALRAEGWNECLTALQSPTDREGDRLLREVRDVIVSLGGSNLECTLTRIDAHLSRSIVGEGE